MHTLPAVGAERAVFHESTRADGLAGFGVSLVFVLTYITAVCHALF